MSVRLDKCKDKYTNKKNNELIKLVKIKEVE